MRNAVFDTDFLFGKVGMQGNSNQRLGRIIGITYGSRNACPIFWFSDDGQYITSSHAEDVIIVPDDFGKEKSTPIKE